MKSKKIISAAAAASIAVLSLSAVFTSAQSISYTANDLSKLRNFLLNTSEDTDTSDLNSDGIIDSLDLAAMRMSVQTSYDEAVEQNIAPVEDNVKIIGRTCRTDDITWLVQSGSATEFTVSGTSASVTLAGDWGIEASADYRPRYAILLDDEVIVDATLSTAEDTITVFEGNTPRNAKIKVIHLSEANNGAIGVKNICVNSASADPVNPTAKKDLSIEFIGDSITCAYGVEGASNSESFKTTTENFMKSYAYLTAEKLGADYSAVCYSGHGIISGYTSSGDINTEALIPPYYDYVGKSTEYQKEWDFSANQNDVVVINLGTNDSGYVSKDIETRGPEFIEGYIDFLGTLRDRNPDSYIICTLGTMGCADVYELVEDAVEQYKSETGDERVMSYFSTTHTQADGYGSDWHPSAVTQQNSAYVLADKICQALGMESDQIGLNVAVDSSYELKIDPDLGGNASHFVSDYDKSFWINMVTGGSAPEAIEAVATGIGLKAGGTYRLEFDYTSSTPADIPVLLRSADDTDTVYFSDSIAAASDKTHFSQEITIDTADPNAEIAFQLGVGDYFNLTLYNIKLTKIA